MRHEGIICMSWQEPCTNWPFIIGTAVEGIVCGMYHARCCVLDHFIIYQTFFLAQSESRWACMPPKYNAESGELEKWAGHMLALQQEGKCLRKQDLSCCTNMQ